MTEIPLSGCTPSPLAYYLKALGVLRLVSDQADSLSTGVWHHDVFRLASRLNEDELVQFFLRDYRPTPVLAPWNGGSGFYPKDSKDAITAITAGRAARFMPYRAALDSAKSAVSQLGLEEKPDPEAKFDLLRLCRNTLSDDALDWLDAVVVLGTDTPKYPPLLGTGGNDGRLEFTNNFMQQLVALLNPDTGEPLSKSEALLRQSLFATAAPGITGRAPIGQFFPGAAGGFNLTTGFCGNSTVNFWDFVFMIEGALLFAAASVKKLESSGGGQLVYPFCVRQAGVGYGSAAAADEESSRCEMWMPLWEQPTSLAELRAVLGEGRAQVNGRAARNGVDFTRAVVTVGVDRGLSAFQRYAFLARNGLSYYAVPLEKVAVRRNARADLLSDIDHWLERFRAKASTAPASVSRALHQLDAKIVDFCKNGDATHAEGMLAAIGRCEKSLARSFRWTTSDTVRLLPINGLRPRWLTAVRQTPEFRLAASVAALRGKYGGNALPFRTHLEPVEVIPKKGWARWREHIGNDVLWHEGDIVTVFNKIFAHRVTHAVKVGAEYFPDWSLRPARLDDLSAFIEGRTNDDLLADLIWGLSLIDWTNVPQEMLADDTTPDNEPPPSSLYSLLRLCFSRPLPGKDNVPVVAESHRLAAVGRGTDASRLAVQRLRGSGYAPAITQIPMGSAAIRTAAALIFPIGLSSIRKLHECVMKPSDDSKRNTVAPISSAPLS